MKVEQVGQTTYGRLAASGPRSKIKARSRSWAKVLYRRLVVHLAHPDHHRRPSLSLLGRGRYQGEERSRGGEMSVEPGWVWLQREAGEEPQADEDAALELLRTELGAAEVDPVLRWNAADFEAAGAA
jgi:hypothetical protein